MAAGNHPVKEALRLRMASLCSRSEQCEQDILNKLLKAGLPMPDCRNILSFLKSEHFIDNARFARAYASDKMHFSGWGRNKIRLMLASKHIDSVSISHALDALDADEYFSKLIDVAHAKAKNLNLHNRNDKMKLYRHLLSRGFESSLVAEVVRSCIQSQS